ncbi:MAG: SH3 domain-containing protein [Pseudomonadota bacterium]
MKAFRLNAWLILVAVFGGSLAVEGLSAQGREPPFWVAVRYDEARMRVGPSTDFPIDWVYRRQGMPMMVIREREGWYLVRDPEGTQGWIASTQLVRKRMVMVSGEGLTTLRAGPQANAKVNWRAQPGVVASLLRCRETWCEIDVSGRSGWVEAARLWGDEELVASGG